MSATHLYTQTHAGEVGAQRIQERNLRSVYGLLLFTVDEFDCCCSLFFVNFLDFFFQTT